MINRQKKVIVGNEVVDQDDFTRYGVGKVLLRKCCRFDGVGNWARTGAIARDTLRSEVTGNTLPTTFYGRSSLIDTTANTFHYTLGISKTSATNPSHSRIYIMLEDVNGKIAVRLLTSSSGGATTYGRFVSTFDAETNKTYRFSVNFSSLGITNNVGYVSDGNTTQSGNLVSVLGSTFIAPSQLADETHGIYLNRLNYNQDSYSSITIEAAIFNAGYTLDECEANKGTATNTIWYKFNAGQGVNLKNFGCAGSDYDLTANYTSSSEEAFHTVVKEN